ncbi:MAG: hypothetical protein A2513_09010 [Sulfurimonas sp. RIFOXYD12_FULL_33_39]|uniref:hypothetical protein n=1 Tax=unclassified Sulfurimonas TaxID=2623549 RepID=UPI0008C62C53|nr:MULTISPECIES: hypothetical protein [unclassified Sulfurimonas]OHE05865.1 MAG: hypothetical protein A3G74_07245 [Sulfurimonas sp. RIFCSPLOWO2_12_FULL_34_6]OHE10220.1 MAG: hypothetical protein A2513_09010 [Sulfurimonas sp. RIFOXYD12_FULL_33_39]OHE14559.1 MAG: hypothetical protein A2530_01470 [Sulfurimonas sp. RIFOXYD2_FULL_34_21]DAB28323.1 MAG TPA: hypothetical protein CFH78_03015 [Sulfurimonas sp. UBA10385]
MLRVIFLLLFIVTFAFGYDDSDLDGVEDMLDKCPQTPFSELVDLSGCSVKKIDKKISLDIITGIRYSQVNYSSQQRGDTVTFSFQSDIYIDSWNIELFTSKYYSKIGAKNKSGFDDTVITLFYKYPISEKLSLNSGVGVILPTYESGYDNEKTDYSIYGGFEYLLDIPAYLFGNLGYTSVKDSDTSLVKYQNISNYSIGIGYMINFKNSLSLSYNQNSSIYKDIEDIKTVRAGYSYRVDLHWFFCADYDYGLNEQSSNHSLLLRIGYGF